MGKYGVRMERMFLSEETVLSETGGMGREEIRGRQGDITSKIF